MWEVAGCTRCKKPLHHISINPMKDEHLTDAQVRAIVDRCEEVYGYKMFHHQRVIIEHVKDGRQHFHVIWNRVSLMTGATVWPGHHWIKSKQVSREMEKKLGLKRPTPRRMKRPTKPRRIGGRTQRTARSFKGSYPAQSAISPKTGIKATTPASIKPSLARPQKEKFSSEPAPFRPKSARKGWPLAAILDWAAWGHREPRRFFAVWPELSCR